MDETIQELDITNSEDQKLFLEHLEDLCSVLQSNTQVLDIGLVTSFKDLYETLEVSVNDLCKKVAVGESVSDESMETLQTNYNQLLQVHEQLSITDSDIDVVPELHKQESTKTSPALITSERGRQSKKMFVRSDEHTVQSINITVAEATEARLKSKSLSKTTISFVPAAVRNQQPGRAQHMPANPVQAVIHHNKLSITAPDKSLEADSLTQLYLNNPRYQAFITEHYSSTKAFERLLDSTITRIEKETTDVFERWLQEEHVSAFLFIQQFGVADILQLSNDPQIRLKLKENNVKYETFLHWIDLIPDMQEVVGSNGQMVFGELFARWVIESKMNVT